VGYSTAPPYPQCYPQCFTQSLGERFTECITQRFTQCLGECFTQCLGECMGECFTQLSGGLLSFVGISDFELGYFRLAVLLATYQSGVPRLFFLTSRPFLLYPSCMSRMSAPRDVVQFVERFGREQTEET
jgi:hypothetical protein